MNESAKKKEVKVGDQPNPPKQGGEGVHSNEEVVDLGFADSGSKSPKRRKRSRKHVSSSSNFSSDLESEGPLQQRRYQRLPDKRKVSIKSKTSVVKKPKHKKAKRTKAIKRVISTSESSKAESYSSESSSESGSSNSSDYSPFDPIERKIETSYLEIWRNLPFNFSLIT